MSLHCFVVLDPRGYVVSTAVISRFHDTRHAAIGAACRMARYQLELAAEKSSRCVCDFDDVPWRKAYRMGFRVRKAKVVVGRTR